ncbi:MAG: hypothetical protein NWF00_06695 [Candidatus Bathyarchaeota archaeon]|nr:hypothetical protein [Candidatus Bathyarchaeota archaeon]
MTETNALTLKVMGKKSSILDLLNAIEKLYPLHIRSELLQNDRDDGYHVFEHLIIQEDAANESKRC